MKPFIKCTEQNAIHYKTPIGINSGIENVVIGIDDSSIPKLLNQLNFSSAEKMKKKYVISFEDTVIVLMGIENEGEFNGRNIIIDSKDIGCKK